MAIKNPYNVTFAKFTENETFKSPPLEKDAFFHFYRKAVGIVALAFQKLNSAELMSEHYKEVKTGSGYRRKTVLERKSRNISYDISLDHLNLPKLRLNLAETIILNNDTPSSFKKTGVNAGEVAVHHFSNVGQGVTQFRVTMPGVEVKSMATEIVIKFKHGEYRFNRRSNKKSVTVLLDGAELKFVAGKTRRAHLRTTFRQRGTSRWAYKSHQFCFFHKVNKPEETAIAVLFGYIRKDFGSIERAVAICPSAFWRILDFYRRTY